MKFDCGCLVFTASWAVVRSWDEEDFAEHFAQRLNLGTVRVSSRSYDQNTILPFDQFQELGQIFLQPLRVQLLPTRKNQLYNVCTQW